MTDDSAWKSILLTGTVLATLLSTALPEPRRLFADGPAVAQDDGMTMQVDAVTRAS